MRPGRGQSAREEVQLRHGQQAVTFVIQGSRLPGEGQGVRTVPLGFGGLADLAQVLPAAGALAKRHVDYGVKPDQYAPVGAALLWTLEQGLGPKWVPETAAAWTKAFTTLSSFMIAVAYGPPPLRNEASR